MTMPPQPARYTCYEKLLSPHREVAILIDEGLIDEATLFLVYESGGIDSPDEVRFGQTPEALAKRIARLVRTRQLRRSPSAHERPMLTTGPACDLQAIHRRIRHIAEHELHGLVTLSLGECRPIGATHGQSA